MSMLDGGSSLGEAVGSHDVDVDRATDLPDSWLLTDRITQALLLASRQRSTAVVMRVKVDGLADRTRTSRAGDDDRVVRELARRARSVLRGSDTVGGVDAHEFAVLLPAPTDHIGALRAGRKVLNTIGATAAPEQDTVWPQPIIGIAQFPDHGADAATLLASADAAAHTARRAGSDLAIYDPKSESGTGTPVGLIEELRTAIDGRTLVVRYHPSVRLSDMTPVRAEALVRWRRVGAAELRSAGFVESAQHAGLGRSLTAFVLEEALERCRTWRSQGSMLGVTINLGAFDLEDETLPRRISEQLARTGVEPSALSLDISEQHLTGELDHRERSLRALKNTGVRLALDDFGRAGASLRLLQRMPFSEVKIDGRYVRDVCTNMGSWSFIRSAIDAAHGLGLELTCEEVQDDASTYVLRRLGCDLVQGHFITRQVAASLPLLSRSELDSPAI